MTARTCVPWRPVWSLFVCCWLTLPPWSYALDEEEPPPPRPIPEIVDEIREAGNRVPPVLYDELARHRSARALTELKKCERQADSGWVRERLYQSLQHFRDDERLAKSAARWLAERCETENRSFKYSAARGLAKLGIHGADQAERLCRSSDDRWIGPTVVGCVLDRLEVKGSARDLDAVLVHYTPEYSGTRERLVEVLSALEGDKPNKALHDFLERSAGTYGTKCAVVDVLTAREDPSELEFLHELLLDSKHAPRAYIIDALAIQGYREHADDLVALMENDRPGVAAAAFIGMIRIGDDDAAWIARLHALADDSAYLRRMAAVEGSRRLVELKHSEAATQASIAVIGDAVADDVSYVRDAALEIVQEVRSADFVPHLIAALETDDIERRDRIEEALVLLTGADHGGSGPRWSTWWEKEGKGQPIPSLDVATQRRNERERRKNKARRTTFYGMNIAEDGVCLLIDASGSMETVNDWGETRFEIAQQETIGALERMPEGTTFNVVFFGTTVAPWRDEMAVMSDSVRAEAIEFVRTQGFLGGTALYDAIESVIEDPGLQNLYVLSDGEPAGGTIDDPEKILSAVKRWNRGRGARIHCVSIGYRSELLARLADMHDGDFREAE
ncbi:MAG: VWA domain-containing protein [Planctomycetota bacterium]